MNNWKEEWLEMPEYNNPTKKEPEITVTFKFRSREDFNEFNKLMRQYIFDEPLFLGGQGKFVKSTWYPHDEAVRHFAYMEDKNES